MRQKSRAAFTLIEMLIVIAIIAVLIAILTPAFTSVLEKGKVTQDMNNLRQIGLATQMYLNDNDGAFFASTSNWMKSLHPKYLASWKIFLSPFDKRAVTEDDNTAPVSYGFNTNAHGTTANDTLLADKIATPSVFVLFAPAQAGGTTVNFSGTAASGVVVDKSGASGGTHNRRLRIDACMADLHVENMSWTTFTNGDPNDKCNPARWTTDGMCQ
ncbi:MAG: hypothetical protein QOG48_2522 [Verrucomicrobiota bacterium]|jgi:prepilin-type N-terminal cleavage/methylation domain-containing protein